MYGRKETCKVLDHLDYLWHRWEDNNKMDLTKLGCEGVDWIHLTQDRNQWLALVNMVMNLHVSQNARNVGWYSKGTYS
jgi:hypothetical protein